MRNLTIQDDNNPDDVQQIGVADFAEATWYLVLDLIDTADASWSIEVLREWLSHMQNQVGNFDTVRHTVTKMNGSGEDTFSFIYNPS